MRTANRRLNSKKITVPHHLRSSENVCHVIGDYGLFGRRQITIYNAKTNPKLLLPLWAVRVEKFLVGLSYSKNLDAVGARFQVRMLASQDNQISCQLEKSPRGPNPG
jgi:hypothetical protein